MHVLEFVPGSMKLDAGLQADDDVPTVAMDPASHGISVRSLQVHDKAARCHSQATCAIVSPSRLGQ